MDTLPYPTLTKVLEVISAANESLDSRPVRQKVLDAMFSTISADGAIFFLPDGNGLYTYIIIKNLDKAYCDYYKTYFYRFDPLQLTRGLDAKASLGWREKTISYDSCQPTEYYNDFLKPQKIHHKLVVNLVAENALYGRIVLTRPQKSNRFNRSEVRTAKTVSPYLAHALAHNDLRRQIRVKGDILDYIEKQSSLGVILLDESLQVTYRNPKAEEVFDRLQCSQGDDNNKDPVTSQLLRDCREIKAGLANCSNGDMMVPRHSMVKGPENTRFSLISRVLEQESGGEGSRMLMVSIEEQSPTNINPHYLMEKYRLTQRETDVVTLLFSGMKNAQIARKLFVSEITVKKHLQHIYEKVGVSNRTTLINRILTA